MVKLRAQTLSAPPTITEKRGPMDDTAASIDFKRTGREGPGRSPKIPMLGRRLGPPASVSRIGLSERRIEGISKTFWAFWRCVREIEAAGTPVLAVGQRTCRGQEYNAGRASETSRTNHPRSVSFWNIHVVHRRDETCDKSKGRPSFAVRRGTGLLRIANVRPASPKPHVARAGRTLWAAANATETLSRSTISRRRTQSMWRCRATAAVAWWCRT